MNPVPGFDLDPAAANARAQGALRAEVRAIHGGLTQSRRSLSRLKEAARGHGPPPEAGGYVSGFAPLRVTVQHQPTCP